MVHTESRAFSGAYKWDVPLQDFQGPAGHMVVWAAETVTRTDRPLSQMEPSTRSLEQWYCAPQGGRTPPEGLLNYLKLALAWALGAFAPGDLVTP